jgi:hypothetical protein
MTEVTILLDEQIVDRAERVANRRNANLNSLVRQYVERLAAQDEESRSAVSELERSIRELRRPMGGVDWTSREELHER